MHKSVITLKYITKTAKTQFKFMYLAKYMQINQNNEATPTVFIISDGFFFFFY